MCMDDYIAPLPQDSVFFFDEPPTVVVEEDRGRRPSRAPTVIEVFPSPIRRASRSPSPSRSRSSSRSSSSRTGCYFSPARPSPCVINLPSSPTPIVQTPFIPPPSWYAAPPLVPWQPPQVVKVPTVDILTFKYNESMAYAPATKTYDEAIDNVLELWSELRDVDRDQIRLLVTGSDHLVRVPRMAWSTVLCDVPRYEVVHVQVAEVPPPPQYQGKGKGKGKWGDNNEKGRRSSGIFSSIRRIFG